MKQSMKQSILLKSLKDFAKEYDVTLSIDFLKEVARNIEHNPSLVHSFTDYVYEKKALDFRSRELKKTIKSRGAR